MSAETIGLKISKELIMKQPLVSVIVPAYNCQMSIEACVRSVLNQTYSRLEIVVIDDGSTDCTATICQTLAKEDPRIHFVQQENGGVSKARNTGLDQARGEYVLFVDSDDTVLQQHIELMLNAMIESDSKVVVAGFEKRESGKHTETILPAAQGKFGNEIWNVIAQYSYIFGTICSKLYSREVIEQYRLRFCESMTSQEDLQFSLHYYSLIDSFYLLQQATYQYNFVSGKRKPVYWDYIQNQIFLLDTAEHRTVMEQQAIDAILDRIRILFFVGLQNGEKEGVLAPTLEHMRECSQIEAVLKRMTLNGEQKVLRSLYLKEKDTQIRYLFCLKRFIKKILKRTENQSQA